MGHQASCMAGGWAWISVAMLVAGLGNARALLVKSSIAMAASDVGELVVL
jgi:hypothetical protein